MYAREFKQVPYKEYICWIQVKIHISDQTSLRICNSVVRPLRNIFFKLSCTEQRREGLAAYLCSKPFPSFASFHQRYTLPTVPHTELDNDNKGFLYSDALASLRPLSGTVKLYILFVITI